MDFDIEGGMDNGEWLEEQLMGVENASAVVLSSTGAPAASRHSKSSSDVSSVEIKSHRGNNWGEDDSILILRAFQYAEEKKQNWESKDIYNNRMFEHFQSLNPSVKNRSAKSVFTRWMEMQSKYKLFFPSDCGLIYRLIVGFNAHRLPGSTGRPSWFTLSKAEQTEFLANKPKNQRRVLHPELQA
jgi:hypothetical protein